MQDGGRCRNAVHVARCRFCDYHVQSEYARMRGTRGQLQGAAIVGRMSLQARQAGATQQRRRPGTVSSAFEAPAYSRSESHPSACTLTATSAGRALLFTFSPLAGPPMHLELRAPASAA